MNLLLIAEIGEWTGIPPFGSALEKHLEDKRHPAVRAASCRVWRLLELALQRAGIKEAPEVRFEETGKPVFASGSLHFSLSHSASLAVALLSDSPCGVDVQAVQVNPRDGLVDRCLNERERELGCDLTECWTKKECMGKLSGKGLPACPSRLDSLDPKYAEYFRLRRITDADGQEYVLCALCMNDDQLQIQKIEPEEL